MRRTNTVIAGNQS